MKTGGRGSNPRTRLGLDKSFLTFDLRGFFSEKLNQAAENQHQCLSPHLFSYLTELLVTYQDSERLFTQAGVKLPVLSDMLHEAMESEPARRGVILKQLGDISLMVSGYFPEAIKNRLVDLTYYYQMGELAYGHLGSIRDDANHFRELAERFVKVSMLLNEIAESTFARDGSIDRLVEFYIESGSERAFDQLKKMGVLPIRPKTDGFDL